MSAGQAQGKKALPPGLVSRVTERAKGASVFPGQKHS